MILNVIDVAIFRLFEYREKIWKTIYSCDYLSFIFPLII
jgi:hypothetical protein